MKVILLENIEDVGKKYEVKEVKTGYARNFLIPKKLAKLATKTALKWLDSQKEVIEKEIEEDLIKAQETASKIDGLDIYIIVKVGQHGELFEGINAQKISEKLKELGFSVKKSQIQLSEPIKDLGEFPIKVNLDHNLEVEISLTISAEGKAKTEAEEE
jgi:large subunit ribosomal protein L9